jgi:hypothetical protein
VSLCVGNPDLPDTGSTCCYGAAVYGPDRCTCWVPVFDVDQAAPDELTVRLLAGGVQPVTRRAMCGDCAYRPGSPEKNGEPGHAGDEDFLEEIAAGGERFWCHQGIRRPIVWRHPSGMEIPGHPAGYAPPQVDAVPYRADGTPAELCAGWDARRRALAAKAGDR